MTIDGDTIVWASAGVAMVAIIAGVVMRRAKREVSTDAAVEKLKLVDDVTLRLNALERRVDFVERDAANHAKADSDAFARIEKTLDSIGTNVSELRDAVTEVLVAARLKDRTGSRSDPSKT